MGLPSGSAVKKLAAVQEPQPAWVRSLDGEDSPGGGHGNPLQYSCLENPMDRGAWQATVRRVTKSRLKPLSTQATIKGIETLLKYSRFQFCHARAILPDAVTEYHHAS